MKLSVILSPAASTDSLSRCLTSLAQHHFTLGEWEVIVVLKKVEGSSSAITYPDQLDIKEVCVDPGIVRYFLLNVGAQTACAEVLLFLDPDCEIISKSTLDTLYNAALEEKAGAVGCLVLDKGNRIKHAGFVVGLDNLALPLHQGRKIEDNFEPSIHPTLERPISALSEVILGVEKKKFELIGGFSEEFQISGADIDLCIRLSAAAFENMLIGTQSVRLHGRGSPTVDGIDRENLQQSLSKFFQGRPDPYYPDHLVPGTSKKIAIPAGPLASKLANVAYKKYQLKSAFIHGGFGRLLEILTERRTQGYSTRHLTYSWPKQLRLHQHLSARQKRHYFIPHLNAAQTFGGIATLVQIAVADARAGHFVNFVLTDGPGNFDNIARVAKLSSEEWQTIGHRFSAELYHAQDVIDLVVSPFDTFVATAWWTKLTIEATNVPPEKLTYIIQDYEVLFYDEGDPVEGELRQLAAKSYENPCHVKINSKFLADFLLQKQILKSWELASLEVFEPAIDPKLFFEDSSVTKKKQIFVYARPDVGRNRFDLCVEALKEAAPLIPADWKIFGLGSLRHDVELGNDHKVIAMSKLAFDDYVYFLKSTPLGLCLMESPHPSYPPLELAACGGLVVCNRYANKDYSLLGRRYMCSELEAQAIAKNIVRGVSLIDAAL